MTKPLNCHSGARSRCRVFNQRGITVERVLSDNGGAYRSHLWRDTSAELEIN